MSVGGANLREKVTWKTCLIWTNIINQIKDLSLYVVVTIIVVIFAPSFQQFVYFNLSETGLKPERRGNGAQVEKVTNILNQRAVRPLTQLASGTCIFSEGAVRRPSTKI